MRITDYKTLTADSSGKLDRKVNEAIGEGWQPFGSLASATLAYVPVLSQAVVKYELS